MSRHVVYNLANTTWGEVSTWYMLGFHCQENKAIEKSFNKCNKHCCNVFGSINNYDIFIPKLCLMVDGVSIFCTIL